jgi:hypothetical protein
VPFGFITQMSGLPARPLVNAIFPLIPKKALDAEPAPPTSTASATAAPVRLRVTTR